MTIKTPFKIDLRRLKMRRAKADGIWVTKPYWEATYPYPGMETVLGSSHKLAAAGRTQAQAKSRLIKQLTDEFGGYR